MHKAHSAKGEEVMGWYGVDLDGTLAEYHGWNNKIGPPIPAMVKRVQKWLLEGKEVKIFTARAAIKEAVSGEAYLQQMKEIQDWCVEHIGSVLEITCVKDLRMIELWDDRCVQVISNTGRRADGKED